MLIKIRRAVLLLAVTLFMSAPLAQAGEKVTLVYTNSLNGWLDYCHCRDNPRGGLVKRATEIKKIRKQYGPVMLFETGDFFAYDGDTLLADYVLKCYEYIRYDAVCPGDQEFTIGVSEFIKRRRILPFVCNNLMVNTGSGFKNYFSRYRIVEKGGVSIGVIGTMHPSVFRYYPSATTARVRFSDQVSAVREDVEALKKAGVSAVVLLSHSGFDVDRELCRAVPGIAVIVGGHSQTLLKKPVKCGRTLLVQAGANGSHIGILQAVIKGGYVDTYTNSFRLPDEYQPADDPRIRRLIRQYSEELKKKYNTLKFK